MSKIERISVDRQAARLPKDLEKYCQKALELGATQAKIIPVQEIVVDDRVPRERRRCGSGAVAHRAWRLEPLTVG